jgi:hypothetical protein
VFQCHVLVIRRVSVEPLVLVDAMLGLFDEVGSTLSDTHVD